MNTLFLNRHDAGRQLASRLAEHGRYPDAIVVALARGGVPVGFEIATALRLPLDVLTASRIAIPGHRPVTIGSVACGGPVILDQTSVADAHSTVIERACTDALREVQAIEGQCRPLIGDVDLRRRTVLLVDDGVATGSTVISAARVLRRRGAKRIVLVTPVLSERALPRLLSIVDDVECLATTTALDCAGRWYQEWHRISEDELHRLLAATRTHSGALATRATRLPATIDAGSMQALRAELRSMPR